MDRQQDAGSCDRCSGAAAPAAHMQHQRGPAEDGSPAAGSATAGAAAGSTPQQQQQQERLPTDAADQQQQQQQAAWLAAWQEQAPGSSGSGGSLGQLLGQSGGGYPVSDTATMDVTGAELMLAASSWQMEPRLPGNRAPSPLDVLGRSGLHAAPQQPARQLSMPTPGARLAAPADAAGYRQAAGVQPGGMSLPASPTMLQYQLQLSSHRSASASHSISPSSGSWPDVDMEQPLAPQLTGTVSAAPAPSENGENGDALLWPSSQVLAPPSSSPQLLHQPGVPLGLQLRLSGAVQQQLAAAAAAAAETYSQQQQQSSTSSGQQPHQDPGVSIMVPQLQQQQQRLQDQALMPPPLPLQPSNAALRSGTLNSAPRPPPLIIPSSQPQMVQPLQHPVSAPTPSSVQPRSGTSVTPDMLSMELVDSAGGTQVTAAAATHAAAAADEGAAGNRQRRQRRRASVPSSPAAAAAAATPQAPSGAAALLAAGRQYIKVVCGSLHGWLDLRDCLVLVAAGQGLEETKVNPSAFEALAGKGATRKWRQTLTVLPDGPTDAWVPQPLPLGEFMKQHQLDKSSAAQQAQGKSSSTGAAAAAAAADPASLLSPAASRQQQQQQQRSMVSPGVRRRRSQHGSQGSSSQEQDRDAGEGGGDDQPLTHAKRSKGSKARRQQQQQYWQDPDDPAYQAAMSATLPEQTQQHVQHQQQQLPRMQRAYSADQALVSQAELQALIAGVPAAAAASSLSFGGSLGLQALQQQPSQQQQQQHPTQQQQQQALRTLADAVVLPLPGLHWHAQSPQLPDSGSADRAEQPQSQPSGGTAAGPSIEQQQPMVLGPAPHAQQQQWQPQQLQHMELQEQETNLVARPTFEPAAAAAAAAKSGAGDAPSKPLLSPAGRPIRQLAMSRQRAAAAAAAAAAARYERGSHAGGYVGGIRHLQVWCDQLPGMLDLHRMQVVPQQGESEGHPMSLSAFEQLGGRGTARKWRRSLTTLDGSEAITLGEWMERYQVAPGTEGKHISPKPSPKPRASTPPASISPAAAASMSSAAHQAESRDQHGRRKQHTQPGMLHPAVASQLPPAQLQQHLQPRATQKQRQPSSVQSRHQAYPEAAAGLPPVPGPPSPAALQRWDTSPSSLMARAAAVTAAAATAGSTDVRRRSRDTSGGRQLQGSDLSRQPAPGVDGMYAAAASAGAGAAGGPAGLGPAVAAGAQAGEPLNAELLLMLNEYAREYSQPELHLHPAQVEQDLQDLTAGAAGALSPRLASMDWQHQQQQHSGETVPAAVHAAALPGSLLQSQPRAAAAAATPSSSDALLQSATAVELAAAAAAGASPSVTLPPPDDAGRP